MFLVLDHEYRREKRIYEADGFRMAAKWKIKKAILQGE
ncbi:hypothetical protein FM120_20825 [Sphingobacterium faecium PCAi_F2.5]|nr:hypothetical protein FM120_20810 [Sphingobacterium faecium PCAi_F2.5]SJN48200.1 hypothetical protein FM120_20825 [Sphingobacterium faecium PCAi_F2.5]